MLNVDTAANQFVCEMPYKSELGRNDDLNQFHGGAVSALVDTVAFFAVSVAVGSPSPTLNLRVDYLRPALGPMLTASASIRRLGRTFGSADVDVTTEDGELSAIGRANFAIGKR